MARMKWVGLSVLVGTLLAGCSVTSDSQLADRTSTLTPVTVFLPVVGGNSEAIAADTELQHTTIVEAVQPTPPTPLPTVISPISTKVAQPTPKPTIIPPTSTQPPRPTPKPTATIANITLIPPAPTTAFDPQGLSVGGSSSPEFIPLLDPRMIVGTEATWLDPDDMILGVIKNGDIRAYPVMQAAYHHVINDTVGGEPYLVTF